MPRTLPWLNGPSTKDRSAKVPSAPRQSRQRSSSPSDLVNSDLDIIPSAKTPQRKEHRAAVRLPSSSPPAPSLPPLAAPDVEVMRDGLDADDVYMMVEDEFDSTARLFTQHIHRAEYQRLKKLHKSRGKETLANLRHGTDSRTEQSKVLRMQLEAKENAKRRKGAELEVDDESEDEYMWDPQLAGLMTDGQKMNNQKGLGGLVKAKSTSRAAAGYGQSPRKGKRTVDVLAATPSSSDPPEQASLSVGEKGDDTNDDDTDDDDLDVLHAQTHSVSTARTHSTPTVAGPQPKVRERERDQQTGFFERFARSADGDRGHTKDHTTPRPEPVIESSPALDRRESIIPGRPTVAPSNVSAKPVNSSRVAEIIARRRQATQGLSVRQEAEMGVKNSTVFPQAFGGATGGHQTQVQSSRASKKEIKPKTESEEKSWPRKRKIDDIPTFLF